jgi:hypothetical protein
MDFKKNLLCIKPLSEEFDNDNDLCEGASNFLSQLEPG